MAKKIITIFLFFTFALFAFGAQAAKVKVFTPADAYNVFKKAMGNRYGLLNANNRTGIQGTLNYIQYWGKISTSSVYMEIASTTRISDFGKLTWFKNKFLLNIDKSLEYTSREGIKQAMVPRFQDLCYASFNSAIANLERTYKTEIEQLEKFKTASTTVCMKAYNNAIKNKENFKNLSKITRLLKEEDFRITKDKCLSDVYAKNNIDQRAKWTTLDIKTRADDNIASTTLKNCLGSEQIKNWVWQNVN